MLVADEVDAEARRISGQIELLTLLHVTRNNPSQSKDLLLQYERMSRALRGIPDPEDYRAREPDPDSPEQVAADIRSDPWIGGIIRQVIEEGRRRQLEEQGQTVSPQDAQLAMARARRERDELLRKMGRPPSPTSVPGRSYVAGRRP